MIDLLKKNMLIGIGLIAMTQSRIREFGKKLAEESKLSEAEGEKFVNELLKQAEDAKKYFESNFTEIVEKKIKNIKLPCQTGFDKLEKELKELKEAIQRLERKCK